jgi:sorting nexin-25
MMLKLQKDFLHKRRIGLEKYLRELLQIPSVCRSRELRSFLSASAINPADTLKNPVETNDFVSRIYSSVADGMEEFLGNIPVLDQLSVAGQNLISAATTQLAASQQSDPNAPPGFEAGLGIGDAEAEAELLAFENKELEPLVKPICDLFLEVFSLNAQNNWLRGRAVVVVLHQLLGGTIERKIRDLFATFTSGNAVSGYVDKLADSMWPRTQKDKDKSRREAKAVLETLIPELASSVVGRQNAVIAARRLEGMLNNERLDTHLVYTIVDDVVGVLFPDA